MMNHIEGYDVFRTANIDVEDAVYSQEIVDPLWHENSGLYSVVDVMMIGGKYKPEHHHPTFSVTAVRCGDCHEIIIAWHSHRTRWSGRPGHSQPRRLQAGLSVCPLCDAILYDPYLRKVGRER